MTPTVSRPSRIALHAAASLLLLASTAHAQSPARDPLATHVDSVFSRYTINAPGCAAAVYRNGATIFAKGYGLANVEYDVPITPATPFIVGSVSKQFTAAAIALLVEEKRLALDDDVRKYVPELPDYGARITVSHLVHHTSGLRDWWELVGMAGLRYDDTYAVQDVLDMTARQRGLNFPPGDRYLYSNTGYILLGVIVQCVTGKSLREFAAERMFGPLQMTSSHFQDDHRQPVRGRAYAYSPAADGKFLINVWNNDLVGQGASRSTVVASLGRIWLFTIADADWRPRDGERVARVGPLPLVEADAHAAIYMEGVFQPGMQSMVHRHPGAEAWWTLEGSMCLETPDGKLERHAGGPGVIVAAGGLMVLTGTSAGPRRSVVLILQDAAKPRCTT